MIPKVIAKENGFRMYTELNYGDRSEDVYEVSVSSILFLLSRKRQEPVSQRT